MIALLREYLRRSWLTGALAAVAVFAFQVIACRVFMQIQAKSEGLPFTRLMPKWVQTAFNISPAGISDLNGFLALCYQHPFVLIVLLGAPVAMLTAFFTGDVEKRTISLVLARPVGRLKIVGAVMAVVLGWTAVAIAAQVAGCHAGASWTGQTEALNGAGVHRAAGMLALLVFGFAGLTAALSAMLSVRGDAVGWALTIVLVMYVWNFLAQVWSAGLSMANYSLFHFYQPTDIILRGIWNAGDAQVLGLVGMVGWLVAAGVYRLRSFAV